MEGGGGGGVGGENDVNIISLNLSSDFIYAKLDQNGVEGNSSYTRSGHGKDGNAPNFSSEEGINPEN